tara:strand:- start:13425 stop:13736 length:312 start_codon:yes stop_codon:yes gene_type:complete
MEHTLFVYGSLMNDGTRRIVLQKDIKTGNDILNNYKTTAHKEFLIYPTIEKSDGDFVVGKTFKVTDEDLQRLDQYETKHYERINVTLESGNTAIVYKETDNSE